MKRFLAVAAAAASLSGSVALAQDVGITPGMSEITFTLNGSDFLTIDRNQDVENRLDNDFSKTSRPCPPFCISPMAAADGVETVGEIELIDYIDTHVITSQGLLVDSRIPEWFQQGSIPGAINIPFATLTPENPYRDDILKALGATEADGVWDFSSALDLLLFSNGPWSDQSPRAISYLVEAGYPTEKLRYYRGGLQVWQILGLTLVSQ